VLLAALLVGLGISVVIFRLPNQSCDLIKPDTVQAPNFLGWSAGMVLFLKLRL
jgi:hypothetical protein